MATPRDLAVIAWIAHMYAIRLDHLRMLLSRQPGAPLHGPLLALSTLDDQIKRWRSAGWVMCERYLANQPAWVWVTPRGLRLVGLDELYDARKPPSEFSYKHIYATNDVRLYVWAKALAGGATWISERRLIVERMGSKKRASDAPLSPVQLNEHSPIPDALVIGADGAVEAIEIERTAKKPAALEEKLSRLSVAEYWSQEDARDYCFDGIHFYVPDDAMRGHVERARATLPEKAQEDILVHVRPSMSIVWRGWPAGPGSASPGNGTA